MTSLEGYRIGCFNAGIDVLKPGKVEASHDKSRHHDDTNANCMMVSVAGLSKAVNIVFDEVLVKAEDQYHMTHNVYQADRQLPRFCHAVSMGLCLGGLTHTMSFHETGARKAAATSCAF